jgi:hypothetical protein
MYATERLWNFIACLFWEKSANTFNLTEQVRDLIPFKQEYMEAAVASIDEESSPIDPLTSMFSWRTSFQSEVDPSSLFIGSSSEDEDEPSDSRFVYKQNHVFKHYLFKDQKSKPEKKSSKGAVAAAKPRSDYVVQTWNREKVFENWMESLSRQVR